MNGNNLRLGCACQFGAAPSWYDNAVAAASADVQNLWNDVLGVWNAPPQTDANGNPIVTSPVDANLVGTPGYGAQGAIQDFTNIIGGMQQGVDNVGASIGSGLTSGFRDLLLLGGLVLAVVVLKD